MSLVEVSPSTVMRFRLSPTASRSARAQERRRHRGVGGEEGEHAWPCWARSCPRPWPCRRRARVRAAERRTRPATSLGWVSVVRIARAASAPPLARERPPRPRRCPRAPCPWAGRTPMTPVEATTTSAGRAARARPRRAPPSRARRAGPRSPVAAFAQPALTTTARARPAGEVLARDHAPGAACARLVVKTPAAAQGASATRSARSRPVRLDPRGHRRRAEARAAR